MLGELRALTTATGKPYRLLPLPWPAAHCDEKGHRLPAGYANFLVVNDAVLVPVYGDTADGPACDVIGEAFPGRRVEPVPCLPLIAQHGSLHCVTMQFPAGVELPGAPIPAAASIT
jgi:agmatine deiminase